MLQSPLLTTLWVVLFFVGSLGVGEILFSRLFRGRGAELQPGPFLRLLHAQLLGLAALGWLLVVLGAMGLWVAPLFHWGVPGFAALGLWRLRRATPGSGGAGSRPCPDHWPLALGGAFFLTFLPFALAPTLHHDDRVYHISLPVRYLEAGGFFPMPFDLYANMPHLTEVLYVPLVAIGDLTAPKVFVFGISAWVLATLYSVGRSWQGPLLGGIAVLLFLSGKNVQSHLGPAYVEPVLGALLLAAVLAGRRYLEEESTAWAIVAGCELGFAAASKYTSWPFVALIVGWLVLASRSWKPLVTVGSPILVFLAPWLAKSFVFTGNPVYPNLFGSLGGVGWSEVQSRHARLANLAAGPGPGRDGADLLTVPFDLTLRDNYFNCPSFSIGVMLLLLGGVALASRGKTRERAIPLLAAAGILGWAATFTQGRYLVAWVPVVVLAALVPLRRLSGHRGLLHLVAGVLVILGTIQLVTQRHSWNPPWWALGPDRSAGLTRNPEWELIQYLEGSVPPGSGVLGMWENRFLFLDRPFETDSVYQAPTGLARLRRAGDPRRFAEELRGRGISHVVVHVPQMNRYVENRYGWDLVHPEVYPRERFEGDLHLLQGLLSDVLVPEVAIGPWAIFRLPGPGDGAPQGGG